MKALLLCAGKGERLRPITDKIPKPLVKVAGKTIIDHNLDWLSSYRICQDVMVNVSYLADKVIKHLGNRVLYSYEPKLLGTAGAIYRNIGWLGDNFLVVNGDTLHHVNLERMLDQHLRSSAVCTIFTKHSDVHNGGVFMFNRAVYAYMYPEIDSIHQTLIPILSALGGVELYGHDDEWYLDCNTPEKLQIAEDFFNAKKIT
jgi:NDP-sugar pyrophosphorylase family protein